MIRTEWQADAQDIRPLSQVELAWVNHNVALSKVESIKQLLGSMRADHPRRAFQEEELRIATEQATRATLELEKFR